MGVVIGVLDRVLGTRLVITSTTEGQHMTNSLHAKGLAIDVRTRNLSYGDRTELFNDLTAALSQMGFDIVLEGDHIHIEYDPKGTERWYTEVD